jgi:DNA-binding helix-hairpin-helix protein with protein kinase domain
MQSIKIGGKAYKLGKLVGKGGEGEVFLIENLPDRAVKIYKEELRRSREPKVRAMIDGGLAASTDLVAFPSEITTDPTGSFRGFAMRLVKAFWPMHQLYGPKSRKIQYPKADYRHLVHAALNVARAVGKVHETGCVIGKPLSAGLLELGSRSGRPIRRSLHLYQQEAVAAAFRCVFGELPFDNAELG